MLQIVRGAAFALLPLAVGALISWLINGSFSVGGNWGAPAPVWPVDLALQAAGQAARRIISLACRAVPAAVRP